MEYRTTVAGLDCGSSTLKAYWYAFGSGEQHARVSYGERSLQALEERLVRDGVRRVRLTGTSAEFIGERLKGLWPLPSTPSVDDELLLQAAGLRHLTGGRPGGKYLLASVGTGVSYSTVKGTKVKRSPLGSCHGGGTIMGLAGLLGVTDFADLCRLAALGTAPDLLVRDKLPATTGTPVGELIIAHFAKKDASLEDKCAGIFSLSAASVFKDLAVLTGIPLISPTHIEITGTVAEAEVFKAHLGKYLPHLRKGVTHSFTKRGAYAAAAGAWLEAQRL
jgi:hypothetical protein